MPRFLAILFLSSLLVAAAPLAPHVQLDDDQLVVDGQKIPYLFGAEVQYFRARGGTGRNVPADQVYALWNKLLDRVVEAKMNAVIFYIPWDFHEPKEGVFDFDGTLDQDGDGKPDYPSRNVKHFLELVAQHGIQHVMLRPGPYINAEWGPEGFGAIPKWFLDNYPQALALNKTPGKPRVVSFANPIFREHAQRWMSALYSQVLKNWIGPGKIVDFLQLDNETNFFWDSVYERDRSADALAHYHTFLQGQYPGGIGTLNAAYGGTAASFDDVAPPNAIDDKLFSKAQWHYDWYLFHDQQIAQYHRFIRQTWEQLGIREPDVLFTTCDSFNSLNNGLLPRLDFRAFEGLSLSTMNVYPKTAGTQADSTLNQPMKAAHDAALFAAAHAAVYKHGGNWVMSSETVGGWFPPVEVSLATRQHTYGSLLGSGVKAMIIYYFHEGENWNGLEQNDSELAFDAPLDRNMEPRPAFGLLKDLGAHLAAGLGDKLAEARPATSPVLIAHDDGHQYPAPGGPNAQLVQSDEMAAVYGWFREAGYLPDVGLLDQLRDEQLREYQVIVWSDSGYLNPKTAQKLRTFISHGGHVITIGTDRLGGTINFPTNPVVSWNTDAYLKQTDVASKLAQLRTLLGQFGMQPFVTATAQDGQPFVHAWVRRQPDGHALLFVENFLRQPRTVSLALFERLLPVSTDGYQLVPLWNTSATTPIPLVQNQATIPVSSDGVDVWEIR